MPAAPPLFVFGAPLGTPSVDGGAHGQSATCPPLVVAGVVAECEVVDKALGPAPQGLTSGLSTWGQRALAELAIDYPRSVIDPARGRAEWVTFVVNDLAMLHGLSAEPGLNGTCGIVVSFWDFSAHDPPRCWRWAQVCPVRQFGAAMC